MISVPTTTDAIVFDVGRVIVRWDMRVLFAKLIGDEAELDWFLANVISEGWHYQADQGRPLQEMIAERQSQYPAYADCIVAYGERFLETIPGPVTGTTELIERLFNAGWPLYAITNFGAEFWERFRPGKPVFDRFRDIVVSGMERIAKPDPAIFRLAERRFGHPANKMLFIDDSAINIKAARELVWQTHLFCGAGTLEQDLVNRGMLTIDPAANPAIG